MPQFERQRLQKRDKRKRERSLRVTHKDLPRKAFGCSKDKEEGGRWLEQYPCCSVTEQRAQDKEQDEYSRKRQASRGVTGARGVGAELAQQSHFSQISLITQRHQSGVSIRNHLRTDLQGNGPLANYFRKSS